MPNKHNSYSYSYIQLNGNPGTPHVTCDLGLALLVTHFMEYGHHTTPLNHLVFSYYQYLRLGYAVRVVNCIHVLFVHNMYKGIHYIRTEIVTCSVCIQYGLLDQTRKFTGMLCCIQYGPLDETREFTGMLCCIQYGLLDLTREFTWLFCLYTVWATRWDQRVYMNVLFVYSMGH